MQMVAEAHPEKVVAAPEQAAPAVRKCNPVGLSSQGEAKRQEGQHMQDNLTYQKFVSLGDIWVMVRFLSGADREAFAKLFQQAAPEDARFMDRDFRDLKTVDEWLDHLDLCQVLSLVAVDLSGERFIGSANLHWWSSECTRQIGEIHIFVPKPFRDTDLELIMLHELIKLATDSPGSNKQ